MKKSPLLFLCFLMICFSGFAQNISKENLQKLAPGFQSILLQKTGIESQAIAPEPKSFQQNENQEKRYSCIIISKNTNDLKETNFSIQSNFEGFATARLSINELIEIAKLESTVYIRPSRKFQALDDESRGYTGANLLHEGILNNTPYKGKNVIVAIMDTGIDWDHPDFKDPNDSTKSRILNIWNQKLETLPAENTPFDNDNVLACCNYGVEYSQTQINDEIDLSPANFVRDRDTIGHGTLVAGTAAANGNAWHTGNKYIGMAPEADIIAIPTDFDEANVIDALKYLEKKASDYNKPIVVNMSFGNQYGAHDGSQPIDSAVNAFVGSGKVVVAAAGNSGGNTIHEQGTIVDGSNLNVPFTIGNYTPRSDTNFVAFTFWFDGNDPIDATVTSPNGISFMVSSAMGFGYGPNISDGRIFIQNQIFHAGGRFIDVFIEDAVLGSEPESGVWNINFQNPIGGSDGDMGFHGWLFYNTMASILNNGDGNYTIVSPASATKAITVGAFNLRSRWTNVDGFRWANKAGSEDLSDSLTWFTSIGPRTDGVIKPEITAPGDRNCSSLSGVSNQTRLYIMPGEKHVNGRGTSYASPTVAGGVALLLQQNPSLTADEIKTLIINNPLKDAFTGTLPTPHAGWGYGKFDVFKAMSKSINPVSTSKREILIYDDWTAQLGGTNHTIASGEKVSIKFEPNCFGLLSGFFFHTDTNAISINQNLAIEIYNDNAGFPQNKIGNTIYFDKNDLAVYSWNFISLASHNINLNQNQNYHLVISGADASDLFGVFSDDNGTTSNRSLKFNGTTWSIASTDYRIRPVMAFLDFPPLPVNILDFTAKAKVKDAILSWKTNLEQNNAGFDIELLTANGFEKVAFEAAKNSGNILENYEHRIQDLKPGTYTYRIKQTDFDGSFHYSNAASVTIEFQDNYDLKIHQALFGANLIPIDLTLETTQNVSLNVYDLKGDLIAELHQGILSANTQHNFQFNATKFPTGLYILRAEGETFNAVKRFLRF